VGLRLLLDTNVILYLLGGRIGPKDPKAEYLVSVISEIELLSWPGMRREEEDRIGLFLADANLIELSPDVRSAAIYIRRRYRLRLPDAVIAGTALAVGAELWTNDKKLLAIPEVASRPLRMSEGGD
jgi:predicted nucleic acid-binding protein